MDKTTAKKWKLLYVLSILALGVSILMGASWLTSEASTATEFKKALAVGFLALALVGGLVAKIGSWFFND